MQSDPNHEYLLFAEELAREARQMVAARRIPQDISAKTDGSILTETDQLIQSRLVDLIGVTYPGHAVLAEEASDSDSPSNLSPAEAQYCWVIDPLDGTRNYAAGLPCYSTAIALLERGVPIVAVVAELNLNVVMSALRGGGDSCNGKPLIAASDARLDEVLVGVPSSKDRLTVQVVTNWMATPGIVLRNLGSTAWQLALVASGGLSATFAKRCKIWDVAAGALLVSEAGGVVTDPYGQPIIPFDLTADANINVPILAGEPTVHKKLLETIPTNVDS